MLKKFREYLYACFSDNGSPSSSRLLMGFFSLFTVCILWRILSHLLKVSNDGNATMLGIWLSNLPLIITALCALIALPYTVNRGSNAISSLAGMVAAFKNGTAPAADAPAPQVQTQAQSSDNDNDNKNTTTVVVNTSPATGSAGVQKG